MPAVGLGTYLMSPKEAEATTKHALGSAGYTHVDTAEVYRNEDGVGKAIRSLGKRRADIYITTKLWPGNPAWGMPLKDGAAAAVQLDKQLALLGVDYVDLYLVHAPFTIGASDAAGLKGVKGLSLAPVWCHQCSRGVPRPYIAAVRAKTFFNTH